MQQHLLTPSERWAPLVEPFWQTRHMQQESVLFASSGQEPAEASLMFTPREMPRLQSSSGEVAYEPGRDFTWEPGTRRVRLTSESRIARLSEAELYPPRGSQKYGTCRDREADLLFADSTQFHRAQSLASYEHSLDGWQTPQTLAVEQRLPRLRERAASRQQLRLVLLGDSISVGLNASGLFGEAPGNPGYGLLVGQFVANLLQVPVQLVNLSVSGMGAAWGLQQMEAVRAQRPDLLVIAFGMNDASEGIAPEAFAQTIENQVEIAKGMGAAPDCVIVAGMSGNPEWTGTRTDLYPRYRARLMLLRREGVAVADVLSVWEALCQRKKHLDLSGNGLNHPNDFGHRVYAQVIGSVVRGATA